MEVGGTLLRVWGCGRGVVGCSEMQDPLQAGEESTVCAEGQAVDLT